MMINGAKDQCTYEMFGVRAHRDYKGGLNHILSSHLISSRADEPHIQFHSWIIESIIKK